MNPGSVTQLGWTGMLRLALVQMALGAVVVLATSTLNRVMIIELSLPALLPATLIALHYMVQLARPRIGYGADQGGRCTPWIIGGMALLGAGGVLAAIATNSLPRHPTGGLALALCAYVGIGLGVGTAGTSNLALLTKRVAPSRRSIAATLMWVMMIAGYAISSAVAGHFLQPFSPSRLVQVFGFVALSALGVAALAVWNVEPRIHVLEQELRPARSATGFVPALRQLWRDPAARSFTLFLFVSMLAFSAQELLIESFAGLVFGFAPGASAQLAGLQHGSVLMGMVAVAILGSRLRSQSSRTWMIGGTLASAAAIAALSFVGALHLTALLPVAVGLLGFANGVFAVAALSAMMELSAAGGRGHEGLRMGLWGASQAVAFALGGLSAGGALDLARSVSHSAATAYSIVFSAGAALFLLAAGFAGRLARAPNTVALRIEPALAAVESRP